MAPADRTVLGDGRRWRSCTACGILYRLEWQQCPCCAARRALAYEEARCDKLTDEVRVLREAVPLPCR